jgi:hypothetical protein
MDQYDSTTGRFDPPQDVIDLLNAKETGEVGHQRPQIQHGEEEPLSYYTEHQAALGEGDFTNLDNGN